MVLHKFFLRFFLQTGDSRGDTFLAIPRNRNALMCIMVFQNGNLECVTKGVNSQGVVVTLKLNETCFVVCTAFIEIVFAGANG